MAPEILAGLVLFAFVATVTPGPNNVMLTASGANFGFRRTVPHMLGITIGFPVMIALVGLGLMQVFDAVPGSQTVLEVASVLYLLYLAWKIAHAGAPKDASAEGRPLSFLQAALFQWVNPKAWALALSAIAAYAPARTAATIVTVALVFSAVSLPSISIWVVLGQQMRRFLRSTRRLTAFNWTMAALLVASLVPVLRH
ncbi:threonine/homoserine/homoserine lactone efflux protein [Palleronia aestuarii]|uniref:Threonine/homoserine/homoserine lactone efflux protein n=1 Tax=Palleronia aestuarii TaxID=568105 RepID=A0A2W7NEH2_9RHOB|nr:LysE family translocator [Palleronia aestuarii]PZX18320.1 threonine/homoserine/homoserine lactone efflux protein [Palleronia aestuarii]